MLECVEWFMVNLTILDELLEAVMVVIVWSLDLQLRMQPVSSNPPRRGVLNTTLCYKVFKTQGV